jgi:glucose-1-phosphate thymidylyltransferase
MTQSAGAHEPYRVVGLVPAAGHGTRLGPLPFSKELLPVAFDSAVSPTATSPRLVCEDVLGQLRRAGVEVVYLVLAHGKWDLPAYLGDGSRFGLSIAYLVVDSPHPAATVNHARAAVGDAVVAFGFPDIVAEPGDALAQVLAQRQRAGADVVLGLFPADRPDKCDLVEADASGAVRGVRVKPGTGKGLAWAMAAWSVRFTRFLEAHLAQRAADGDATEVHVGHVFAAALDAGLDISSVTFPDGWYLDVGTAEDWRRALERRA